MVTVRYHWNYPSSSDPFYQYNTDENMGRLRFYNTQYVPDLWVDGVLGADVDSLEAILAAINQRRATASPCTINVFTAVTQGDTVEATVRVTAEEDMHNANTRLFIALNHRCYEWDSEYHKYPFRDMEPDTLGASFQLDADSTFEFITYFATDTSWDVNDLSVVAFVQLYNTKEVLQAGFADVGEPPPTLFINEFMTDNTSTIQDPQGEYEDWIELYNPGPYALNLDGLSLTDDLTEPDKWTFPDTLLSIGGYLIVWCDSDFVDPGLHTNLTLASDGGQIGLFTDLTTCHAVVDSIHFRLQTSDTSYGRKCDCGSEWDYLADPTPGATNFGSVKSLTILLEDNGVRLFWQTNDCASNYTIYRHDTFPFVPSPSDSIGFTSETTYLDAGIILTSSNAFYRVIARP